MDGVEELLPCCCSDTFLLLLSGGRRQQAGPSPSWWAATPSATRYLLIYLCTHTRAVPCHGAALRFSSQQAPIRSLRINHPLSRPSILFNQPPPSNKTIKTPTPQYRATDFVTEKPGTFEMTFKPSDGSQPQTWKIYDYKGSGVGMAMYNTDEVTWRDMTHTGGRGVLCLRLCCLWRPA